MIPKKLHFTYKTDDLPKIYQENLARWKDFCPDWEIYYYSNEKVYEFFNEYFPKYSEEIAKIKHGVVLADLFRYAVLYIHGGMYSDIDTIPLKRIPKKWLDMESVLGYEYQPSKYLCMTIPSYSKDTLCQWSFLSRKGHPLFKEVLENCIAKLKEKNFKFALAKEILETTGPILFTEVSEKYLLDPKVLVLDMDVFAPIYLKEADFTNAAIFHQFHGTSGWKLELQMPHIDIH